MKNNCSHRKVCSTHLINIGWLLAKQQGFALIWLCTLLPAILTTIIFVYAASIQIEIKSALHQLCRRELLAAQAQSSKIIQKIMTFHQTKNDVRKQDLGKINALTQQALVNALAQHNQFSLKQSQSAIQKSILGYQKKLSPFMDLTEIEVSGNPYSAYSIQMNIHHSLDFSEPIQLNENFERLQSLTLSWKYQLKLSRNFIIESSWSQNFEGHCSATLKKEKPWPPILYEDKFFWKPS